MARDAGAKKVIMASCAPPIRYSNVYGIDMPSRHELVAHGRTEEEIAEYIGADMVIFQTLEDLIESCRKFNPAIETFDCSVFTGEYVTGGVDEEYLNHIQSLREDNAKNKTEKAMRVGASAPGSSAANGAPASATGMVNGNGSSQHTQEEMEEESMGCSGPMNGADANIGLYNGPRSNNRSSSGNRHDGGRDSIMGLSNSHYAGIATMDINDTGVSEGANAVAGGAGSAAQPTSK